MAFQSVSVQIWLLSFTITIVTAVYIPSNQPTHLDPSSDVCPVDCLCILDKKTASCSLANSNFSLDALSSWKLESLRLKGDIYFSYLIDDTVLSFTNVLASNEGHGGNILPVKSLSVLSQFKNLVNLEIMNSPMGQVSDYAFVHMPELQQLSLPQNNITVIHPRAFHGLLKLRILNLGNNRISSLPDGVFVELSMLTTLDLSGNNLHEISVPAITGLVNLENLDLHANSLQHIEGVLHNLLSLNTLDISSNQIHYILNETAKDLSKFDIVSMSNNPFQCSCAIGLFVNTVQSSASIFGHNNVTCAGPKTMIGQDFNQIIIEDLPCYEPEVATSPGHIDVQYQTNMVIHCSVSGSPPLGVVWHTPWGDSFAHYTTQSRLPHLTVGTKQVKEYWGINLDLISRVFVSENNSLHVNKFRGYFIGSFTCVSLNLLGSANSSVETGIFSKVKPVYVATLFFGGICASAMLVLGCIIGVMRWCVSRFLHTEGCNCCCCQSEDEVIITDGKVKFDEEVIEVVISESGESSDRSDDFHDFSPPKTPFNSPMLQTSPETCSTPVEGQSETDTWISGHILDQLEDVRSRLRCEAVRKYEKVRSLGRTITESGTVRIRSIKDASTHKIQSIKESGSKTATIVRNSVASGMVQVKYGVQSIKEFCGTGEMGPGTISMISVSTDVDTKEQVRIVKSHTFV